MYVQWAVDYEWDPAKARINQQKHGVRFADAVEVFADPLALTLPSDYAAEERMVTMGLDALGRLLVVVYTVRADRIRMISARKATARERMQYEGATDETGI